MDRKNFFKYLGTGAAILTLPSCKGSNTSVGGNPPPGNKPNPPTNKSDILENSDFQWGQFPVGGGGYVTGIVIHPENKDIMYIRTDVGGSYRWDAGNRQWVQMLNWVGPDNGNLIGVDGMAIDPTNPDRIYLALGKNINGEGGIYRSEDRGKNWEKLMSAHYEGNGRVDRWTGECIAVDSNSSNIIYAGTRTNGLFRSTDDGVSWSKLTDVPDGFTGTDPIGIRSIVFDPAVQSDGRSSVIYVGIPETGVYYSSDGGDSFALLTGSPNHPSRMQVVSSELFVTHSTGVILWSDGQWSDITPASGKNKNYVGLAVDRADSNNIVVAQHYSSYYNPIYRSQNKGTSWEQLNTHKPWINPPPVPINKHVSIPWWPQNRFSSATSCMAFVPGSSGNLYYTDWFGVWNTPNVWNATTDWYTIEKGHEETVILTLVAPPDGALVYSGMGDDFGFRHKKLNSYPDKKLYDINEGFNVAVCEKHPENIAILGATEWDGTDTLLATSSDYGQNWNKRSLPIGTTLGRIAISATDPDNMVYVAGGGEVYYSKDRGNSWAVCQGAPVGAVEKTNIWNKQFVLEADRVNSSSFYLFKSGNFYASTDGGVTWQVKNRGTLPKRASRFRSVFSMPGAKGVICISCNDKGLWKTVDGGKTFEQLPTVDEARFFSWGAPAPGSEIPIAYCYGKVNGQHGLYLYGSVDMGESWARINDDEHQFCGDVAAIAGDRNKFGQIYIGTGGCGIFYSQLSH
jgi:photosystem II stability/assembly factor-like uncharacterized protein